LESFFSSKIYRCRLFTYFILPSSYLRSSFSYLSRSLRNLFNMIYYYSFYS
jgi:hypothetical protein